jgi:hypothetical protein
MTALFDVVAGAQGPPPTPRTRVRGLRTVAFDGCNSLKVPDTQANRSWLARVSWLA